jgi:prepilin-type N-terminal cleavage/methylation domain-containing protein/prepilin-type processing-associated H-X9-DG protein
VRKLVNVAEKFEISVQAMNVERITGKSPCASSARADGFTLIEVLLVLVIIAVLAAILLPALAKARERGQAILCLNNTRQLELAWQLYADDHESLLPYNLVMKEFSFRTNINWVNNVMTWDLSSDNTNTATITEASLGPYASGVTSIYRCPSDRALSVMQSTNGWDHRIRSYSMNAMMGDVGASLTTNGVNVNNPGYKQFLKITEIPHSSEIFVFLDEHPDSIDDGYFVNKAAPPVNGSYGANTTSGDEWQNLPASYHNRATAFSFADGHASLHRWLNAKTIQPAVPNAAHLPIQILDEHNDFDWMMEHMSIQN